MAKHLGPRRQPRLAGLSPRVLWSAGGCAVVATVAIAAVAQGLAFGDDPGRPAAAGSATAQHSSGPSGSGQLGLSGQSDLSGQSGSPSPELRRVGVSRQNDRPRTSSNVGSTAGPTGPGGPYEVRQGARLALKPAVALARKVAALSPAHSTFTIAQSNVLGSQHTRGKGGYGPGTYRAGITASLLTSRGADVGGMQEVQSDQLAVLRNRMPSYSFWPGTALGHNGERLQIYWRTSQFSLVRTDSVTYTFSGQRIPLPYVLLRDNATGAEFWMITTHNSAGGLEGQRDAATAVEIGLINRLRATGVPVIITGDMNEHTEFFCRVAGATGMVAANGGSGAGGCQLPPRPLRVDWIMGGGPGSAASSGGAVSFSGYHQDGAGLHRASDHYYLYAQVAVTSGWFAPNTGP
jgi:hypothetical protein